MTAIRAIHAGRRQLGIEEEDARDIYERMTGKRSLRAMSENERQAVVGELRRMGFSRPSNPTRKKLEGKYAPKLQALWIALWNFGVVNNRDDAALLAFVKRQTDLDHARFLHHSGDARKVIEALKGWLKREGVEWSAQSNEPEWENEEGYRITIALWWKLYHDKGPDTYSDLMAFASLHAGKHNIEEFRNPDWVPVMNELGRIIRGQKT